MHDVFHTVLCNMIYNDNLGGYDPHATRAEHMLEAGFRLWWETSDYADIRAVDDPPLAGHFFNLWLIDPGLVDNPHDAAYFIRQMTREERYARRPDQLHYSRCLAYDEQTTLFRDMIERLQRE